MIVSSETNLRRVRSSRSLDLNVTSEKLAMVTDSIGESMNRGN